MGPTTRVLAENDPCWGREVDIERLTTRIYADRIDRSATLICGESGIGKTKLLNALRVRLNEPSVFCGYAQAYPGDRNDPLARALDDLLKRHIYSLGNWHLRIRAATQASRSALRDVDKLNSFCAAIASAVLENYPLAGIAKPLASALGKGISGPSKIAGFFGIGRSTLKEFAGGVSCEIVEDILIILTKAFPDRRFVLMLDNISADTESFSGLGRTRNLDSLAGFLPVGFRRLSRIHLVATWKLSADNAEVLKRLSGTWREYGGEIDQLGPLNPRAGAEWLETKAWFRSLTTNDQTAAIQIAGGLPQVMAAWNDLAKEGVALADLRAIARDAAERKFSSLRNAVLKDDDRELLYQLAVLPWIPPNISLSDLTGREVGKFHDWIGNWVALGLINRNVNELVFSHETKRDVVRVALEGDDGLAHSTRQAAVRLLLQRLIENANARSELHPRTLDYLNAVAEIDI